MSALAIADAPERKRYEATLDGELVGFVQYQRRGEQIAFVHTEIEPEHEGEGVGSQLVATALDDARAAGLAVLPFCPFVRGYIERHREYVDLVPAERRDEFGL